MDKTHTLSIQDIKNRNRETDRLLSRIKKHFPKTFQTFTRTKFDIPFYRQQDYPHYTYSAYDDILAFGYRFGELFIPDFKFHHPTWEFGFFLSNAWASMGMRTLFLERELAEALSRTDLPEGFTAEDINWKWPSFRLFFPKGLYKLELGDAAREVVCVTLTRLLPEAPIDFLPCISNEVIEGAKRNPDVKVPLVFQVTSEAPSLEMVFQIRKDYALKESDAVVARCRLDDRTLTELSRVDSPRYLEKYELTCSQVGFLESAKRMVFNVLLFLGSIPLEYDKETILRPASEKKGNFIPEIRKARFVGQEAYRPSPRSEGPHEHTGRKLPSHWRAGAWRRQVYGPQRALRKLIWVQPYRTHGPEAVAAA